MKNIITINSQEVEFTTDKDNTKVFTDSVALAKTFDKNHSDMVRHMKADEAFSEFLGEGKIALRNYKGLDGKYHNLYDFDRDSFMYFAMSFTGSKAKRWKLDFIKAFNMMENNIKEFQVQLLEAKFEAKLLEAKKCNVYANGYSSVRGVKQHLELGASENVIWDSLEDAGIITTETKKVQVRTLNEEVPAYIGESKGTNKSPVFNPEAVKAIVENYVAKLENIEED